MLPSTCIAPRHSVRVVAKRLLKVGVSGVEPLLRGPAQASSPRTRSASPRTHRQPALASPRPRQVALPSNFMHAAAIGAFQLLRASAAVNSSRSIAMWRRCRTPGAGCDQASLDEVVAPGAAALPALPSAIFGAVRELQGAASLPALLTAISGEVRRLQGVTVTSP